MKENVEKTALERLHRRQSLIKDRIRAVVYKEANGVYLHGRPGSSKTYLICKTLEDLGVRYGYSNGHLTPLGLFDLLAENQNSVIVLDDVSSIFNAPQSLQILLRPLAPAPTAPVFGMSGTRRLLAIGSFPSLAASSPSATSS